MKQAPPQKIKLLTLLALAVLSVGLSGCSLLRYLAYMVAPEGKGQWVPAETEALTEGKKVLVLVYADENIQYRHDQLARYNTAAAVAEQMESKLKVDPVEPWAVETFQANHLGWTDLHLTRIGQRFGAEFVLYIELQEFTIQAEESGELLQGRMDANASLYTVDRSNPEVSELLWQDKLQVVYPPNHPVVAEMGASDGIRRETYRLFAEKLVKHFYGHYEPY